MKRLDGRFDVVARDERTRQGAVDRGRWKARPEPEAQLADVVAAHFTVEGEPQRLALAAHALRIRADEEMKKLPAPAQVYAAAKKADVLLAVGKGTPTTGKIPLTMPMFTNA